MAAADPEITIFKSTPQGNLRAHVFVPDLPATCAIVSFVCGGWIGFDATVRYPEARALVARGAVVIVAEVRVLETHGTTPAECVTDAKSAMRWVRRQADQWGVRKDRVVAAGSSAAGAVALATAMVEGFDDPDDDLSVSCSPNAVCAYNPAVLKRLDPDVPLSERERIRLAKFGSADLMWALSPMRGVRPGLPPVLIMHGDNDVITLLEHSAEFAEKMIAAGNACRLITYPGGVHGFHIFSPEGNPYFDQTLRDLDGFLVRLGFLEPR